jgi:hypothetical protein
MLCVTVLAWPTTSSQSRRLRYHMGPDFSVPHTRLLPLSTALARRLSSYLTVAPEREGTPQLSGSSCFQRPTQLPHGNLLPVRRFCEASGIDSILNLKRGVEGMLPIWRKGMALELELESSVQVTNFPELSSLSVKQEE